MIRSLVSIFLLVAAAAADATANAEFLDVLMGIPRAVSSSPFGRRDVLAGSKLLSRDFVCNDVGYFPCPGEDYCCPDGGLCCDTGGCAAPGGECCAKGVGGCDPGFACCEYGCIPVGQNCCKDGNYCPTGSSCVLENGQPRCCNGLGCLGGGAGGNGNGGGGNGGNPVTNNPVTSIHYTVTNVPSEPSNTVAGGSTPSITQGLSSPQPTPQVVETPNPNAPNAGVNPTNSPSTPALKGVAPSLRREGAMPIIGLVGAVAAIGAIL